MERFKMYIAGEFVEPDSGSWFETENPFEGKSWAEVARANAADADKAVTAAHRAFSSGDWPALSAYERGRLLTKIGDLILQNSESLALAELRDNGKSISEVRGQMKTMASWYHYYGGLADKIEGQVIPADENNFLTFTQYEPLGVVAAITPWNSPLRLMAWKVAPALAAGNTVVVKPSEFTSTSSLILMELFQKAGVPPGVVNVVTGFGNEVGLPLVEHPLVAKVSFTGGVAAGMRVYEAAARGMKRVTLELGGKSPNIVFADADLEEACAGAVAGIFGSTGQTCIAGSRLLVQESIQDEVVGRVVAIAKAKKMGNPMDPKTEIGPVANRPQFDRIMEYIRVAKEDGAALALGGKPGNGPDCGNGLFIEPTIFTRVDNRMRIAQEEVFGPILAVIPFKDEEDAVRIANDIQFGLAAGIWTRDVKRAHRMAKRIQAGTVWVNTYRRNSPAAPFGGFKKSGLGRESGIEMIKDNLQVKTVWVNLH
jgi:aldehyde dehydrogenase (NAD+)